MVMGTPCSGMGNQFAVLLACVEDGQEIYFGSLLLGSFDERTMKKIYGNLRSMKPATAQLSPMSMD